MTHIEADFEVFKSLTAMRRAESDTYNDVLRRLLKLPPGRTSPPVAGGCTFKGVNFPEGTLLRANYKGKIYTGEIKGGAWLDASGSPQSSPSQAAYSITGSGVNGWRFWEGKRPQDAQWTSIGEWRV